MGLEFVTPCAGVWIEITKLRRPCFRRFVTPCAGVWIEIQKPALDRMKEAGSLPVRECGLKSWKYRAGNVLRNVTPCAGVWIEMKLY